MTAADNENVHPSEPSCSSKCAHANVTVPRGPRKDRVNHELLLGIDIGTSLTKVGVFTTGGTVVRLHSASTPITWDGPQEAHHDPDALWAVVAGLIRRATTDLGTDRLVCIGISSFGEAGVLLDADGTPRTSILSWFDLRPKVASDELHETFDLIALRRRTGLMADHTYSLSKLLWFKRELSLEKLRWVSVTDWIAYKLTGTVQMGVTQASRTLLFDLETRTWLEEVMRELGLPQEILAPLRLPGEPIGTVTKEAAARTGLVRGLPVMESAHDQPCAAAGVGATEPGVLLNACGTAEILLTTLEHRRLRQVINAESVAVGHHALPGRYWAMASLRASGSVFDWFVHMLDGLDSGSTTPTSITPEQYQRVIRAASAVESGADGIAFVPHLRQLSDDPQDASLSGGVFTGLRETHGPGHLARAVLEGLSLESERLLRRVQDAVGHVQPTAPIRAVGGPTRNAVWMQTKADLFGLPIQVYSAPNATTWGAAWLAWYHLNNAQGTPIPASVNTSRETVYQPVMTRSQADDIKATYRHRVRGLLEALEPR